MSEPAGHDMDTVVVLAHQVFGRHFAVFKHQFGGRRSAHAHLLQLARHGKPGELLFHDEGADPFGPFVRVGLGVNQQGVGDGTVGDEDLGAVENVFVALFDGPGAHAHGVGTGIGFGEPQGADLLSVDQRRQVLLLEHLIGVFVDIVGAKVGMSPVGHGQPGTETAHLFDGQGLHKHIAAQTTVFFIHGDAENADFGTFLEKVRGKPVFLVDFFLQRAKLIERPLVDRFLDHALFVCELKIHVISSCAFELGKRRVI